MAVTGTSAAAARNQRGPRFKVIALILIVPASIFCVLLGIRTYNQYRFHLEKDTRVMMDTFVAIYCIGPKKISLPAMELAFSRMNDIYTKFNIHDTGSPIYEFNHHDRPIEDPEIVQVVRAALDITRQTHGAFDITVSPLISLWGFYGDSRQVPDVDDIKACLKNIGPGKIEIKDNTLVKKQSGIRIDLGGIAKGYAIAQAVEILQSNGVNSALVDAGGDIYALGKKAGKYWHVGIRGPGGTKLQGYLEVAETAVMGTGDYERFFMENGKRYHHIFDPATGYPAASGISGITLIHPDPMLADAYATALFVLGPVKGLALVEQLIGMEVLMVTSSGEKILSSGLKNKVMDIPEN